MWKEVVVTLSIIAAYSPENEENRENPSVKIIGIWGEE